MSTTIYSFFSQATEISQTARTDLSSFSLTKNVRKTELENGLTVLTKEVNTTPVVAVQVWYGVGADNEPSEAKGIAHQLEHMMFKGTVKRPIPFAQLFNALGSEFNASTSYEYTNYFHTAESKNLRPLLILEADRLRNAQFSTEELKREKGVVISELQGYENSPVYRLNNAVMKNAFPSSAYGLPIGGIRTDVENLTVEQIRNFYRQYYTPDNATLVIVGNFDTEPTLKTVKELFGKIPRRSNLSATVDNEAFLSEAIVQTIEDGEGKKRPIELQEPGNNLLLQAVYPLPARENTDVPAIKVLDAILTKGRNSRLKQALVDSGLAIEVTGTANNFKRGGWYTLLVRTSPQQEPNKIVRLLEKTIAELIENGVSEVEVRRVKEKVLAFLIMQSRGISNQATLLGYSQTTTGDYRYLDRYLAAINRVTSAKVEKVARQYFTPSQRTIGLFSPTESNEQSNVVAVNLTQTSENFNLTSSATSAEIERYLPSAETTETRFSVLLPEQFTLNNGLKVLLLPDDSTPTITLSGHVRAGAEFDFPKKSGLAALTANNLMNGTKTKDALKISQELEDRGANLNFTAHREGVNFTGYSLAKDLPTLITIVSDVLQNATFPTQQFQASLQRMTTALSEKLNNPGYLGQQILLNKIYPENHPYHNFSTPESLKQIAREDVTNFYHNHYRPDTTTITITGKFDSNQVRMLLENQLGSWQSKGKLPTVNYPSVNLPTSREQYEQLLAGTVGSITYMGHNAIKRQDSRYYTALVLNQILGGDTLTSRLGREIRERMGITYGVFSLFFAGKHSGPFMIGMQTAPGYVQKAVSSTINILQQFLQYGVTKDEVEKAKLSLISTHTIASASPDTLAAQFLYNETHGLPLEEVREYIEQIEKVDVEQVNQVARELLHPDSLVVVTIKPTEKKGFDYNIFNKN